MKLREAILPRDPVSIEETRFTVGSLIYALNDFIRSLTRILNGRISFGDGSNLDNIFGSYADITADATPDVEFSVTHSTGKVPGGFIVLWQDRAGSLYKGGTAWTSSTIYLKSSVASLQARIFVI